MFWMDILANPGPEEQNFVVHIQCLCIDPLQFNQYSAHHRQLQNMMSTEVSTQSNTSLTFYCRLVVIKQHDRGWTYSTETGTAGTWHMVSPSSIALLGGRGWYSEINTLSRQSQGDQCFVYPTEQWWLICDTNSTQTVTGALQPPLCLLPFYPSLFSCLFPSHLASFFFFLSLPLSSLPLPTPSIRVSQSGRR